MSEAGISNQRMAEFAKNVLLILKQNPEGLSPNEVIKKLSEVCPPTEHEKTSSHGGRVRFNNNIYFLNTRLFRSDATRKENGLWIITDLGKELLANFPEPEALYHEVKRVYGQYQKALNTAKRRERSPSQIISQDVSAAPEQQDEEISTDDSIEDSEINSFTVAYEQAKDDAFEKTCSIIDAIEGEEFQEMVAELLKAMGYYITWKTKRGPDGGVDIIICQDSLGMGKKIKVQVKRQEAKIGAPGLRSFIGILESGGNGIFVCTGGFNDGAKKEAIGHHDNKWVKLIDRDEFIQLWISHYTKLTDSARARLALKPVYFPVTDQEAGE